MTLSIDEVFQEIGEFHKFQWLMLTIIGYTVFATATFPVMIVTFITAEPNWQCVKGYNSSICNFNESIGLTSKYYKDRCDMPREAWTYVEGFTSTVTEYDLVCDKSILQSVAQSCYWIGMLLGLLFGGYLSDRFGRKKIFTAGVIAITIVTWIMIFPKSFVVFIVCRIIIGVGLGFRNATTIVLLTEFTTQKHRAKIGASSALFWAAGLLVLPLIGYFVPEWRYFLLVTACFAVPCLFMSYFILESVRWLQLQGKDDIARKELEKVARINRKEMPKDMIKEFKETFESGNFKHLFYSLRVAKVTLISWNMWFATSLVYYGVSYGSVDLGGNRYLNFALSSIVELPSNVLSIISANRFGRKKTVIVGLLLAFVASIISVLIPGNRSDDGYTATRIIMSVLAKFFINMSFSGIYIWSTELFPTFIRGMGVSTSSAAARLGSFSASYIVWLIRVHPMLPYGIMGMICLQAAITAMFLPETKGKPTLETLDDMVQRASSTAVKFTVTDELVIANKATDCSIE
ncbi:solute carrier family 22 member 15-like [Xenia sp. Carnegie-2017]|uniref:solute carrier family 22 member 15-like n=1 Tax=Xenia sp. Carnegie-2017 TaxID=2897299 RepID=UPI001F03F728|nr:solute carrier family 22 member 15-like [Xenia sp. Carnegie-2017]